jgi:hypothetical protein
MNDKWRIGQDLLSCGDVYCVQLNPILFANFEAFLRLWILKLTHIELFLRHETPQGVEIVPHTLSQQLFQRQRNRIREFVRMYMAPCAIPFIIQKCIHLVTRR